MLTPTPSPQPAERHQASGRTVAIITGLIFGAGVLFGYEVAPAPRGPVVYVVSDGEQWHQLRELEDFENFVFGDEEAPTIPAIPERFKEPQEYDNSVQEFDQQARAEQRQWEAEQEKELLPTYETDPQGYSLRKQIDPTKPPN